MDNPYQIPGTLNVTANASTELAVSPEGVRVLAGTKGWVRFLGVLGFVMTAFMVIGGIGIMAMTIGIGISYLVFSALNFFAAFKLNQYASRIGALMLMPSELGLLGALEAQRGFWKYVGIMGIVTIAFYVLAIFGGVMSAIVKS